MKSDPVDVALVLMAKEPIAGTVKTRLVPPLDEGTAAALAEAMLLDSIVRLESFGDCDRWIAYAPVGSRTYFERVRSPGASLMPQPSGDLGDRMRSIVEVRLAGDSAGVILTGSDLPNLPESFIRAAVDCLRAGSDLVLGPTEDGGYYLIGLRVPRSHLFDGIRWSTPTVLADTIARARASGVEPDLLPPWYDVDDHRSLDRLRSDLAGRQPAGVARHTIDVLRSLYSD